MDISVTERERKTPAPQAEQRLSDARQLCGNYLYVMKLPFSHSPSVIKPSQAMRTARHHHGGGAIPMVTGTPPVRPECL